MLLQLALHLHFVIDGPQVYNEQIRDLLANVGPLAVREDSSKGVVVQGLTLHKVCKLKIQYSASCCSIFSISFG